MKWRIEFLEDAERDMKKLDHSVQIQVLKGIRKVSKNPVPTEDGGYGKPLGNKSGTNLTIEQVASAVGYSNASRFASLFRKSTGLFPSVFRKLGQNPII